VKKNITSSIISFCWLSIVGVALVHKSFAVAPRPARPQVTIRVCIGVSSSLKLAIDDTFEIIDPVTNSLVKKGRNYNRTIHLESGKITDDWAFNGSKIYFRTGGKSCFSLNGNLYRGNVEFIIEGKKVVAVNHVSIEDYIKSVVPSEIHRSWRQEALKAQAVAARTFAYYHLLKNRTRAYDIAYGRQEYKGMDAEHAKTSWAVDVTFGQVLQFKNEVFPAYFHAVCGGYTEEASVVWSNSENTPRGAPCTFCKNSRYYEWNYFISEKDLLKKLNNAGFKLSYISSVEGYKRSPYYPRHRSLKVVGDTEHIIPVNKFREIVGYGNLRSSIFTIRHQEKKFFFDGKGWGHGAGLCQYGCKTMAEQGVKYQDMLRHYYPDTEIKRAY